MQEFHNKEGGVILVNGNIPTWKPDMVRVCMSTPPAAHTHTHIRTRTHTYTHTCKPTHIDFAVCPGTSPGAAGKAGRSG